MNRMHGTALSDKEKILNVFNKQHKATAKRCCSVSRFAAASKCFSHHRKTDERPKMKRLRSRKERSQIRRDGKKASNTKSHHCHCCHQTSKDMTHFLNCCHSSSRYPSRRTAVFPNVAPAAQEPSIITDSRLIGHQGLFNHEVKSVNIERLLSEQRKLEKSEQQVQDKTNATSHPSKTSPSLSTFSTYDLLSGDTDAVLPFEKKADPATKAHDDCQEKQKTVSQGSDLTPGQRPQQHLDVSSESDKRILSSKHSSPDVVIIKCSKTNPVMSEEGREAPDTDREDVKPLNKKVKEDLTSTLDHTPKNLESPFQQTQHHGLDPGLLLLSSSHLADCFEIQHRRQLPDCVSKSVSAVAARLCDSLQFPLRQRRSLVAESREVLLKALQEKHGAQLQENLHKMQQCLGFGSDPAKEVQDEEPTIVDKDKLLSTDAFTAAIQPKWKGQPRFDTQKTTSSQLTRNRYFDWKSSPQLHHNLKQTAEWLTRPVETPVSLLDDILRPTSSPQFCMDFEPSEVIASDHVFAPSSTSCWGEKASTSQDWEDGFNRPKNREAVMFGSSESSFMNHTRAVTERSCNRNIHPFFPCRAQLPDRHAEELRHFPQEQDRFETDRYSVAPFSSALIHHHQQSNCFKPFSQFSHPSTCPPLRSHHSDMMHYPPSHMLERDRAPSRSSFQSPEHWSFPPMRLY